MLPNHSPVPHAHVTQRLTNNEAQAALAQHPEDGEEDPHAEEGEAPNFEVADALFRV